MKFVMVFLTPEDWLMCPNFPLYVSAKGCVYVILCYFVQIVEA